MSTVQRLVLLCVYVCGAGAARRRDYEPYMFAAVPLHAPVPVLRVLSPAPLPVAPLRAPRRPYPSTVQRTPFTRPYTDHGAYESRPYSDVRPYTDPRPYTDTRSYDEPRPYGESRPFAGARPYRDSPPYGESPPYGGSRPFAGARPYRDSPPYSESPPYGETRPYGGTRPYLETVEYYDESVPAGAASPQRQRPAASSAEYAVEWEGYALPVVGANSRPHAASLEEAGSSQETGVLYARPEPAGGYTYRKLAKKPPKKVPKEQPVLVKIHKHKIIKS